MSFEGCLFYINTALPCRPSYQTRVKLSFTKSLHFLPTWIRPQEIPRWNAAGRWARSCVTPRSRIRRGQRLALLPPSGPFRLWLCDPAEDMHGNGAE